MMRGGFSFFASSGPGTAEAWIIPGHPPKTLEKARPNPRVAISRSIDQEITVSIDAAPRRRFDRVRVPQSLITR